MGLRSPQVPFSQMNLQQSSQYARNVPVVPDAGSVGSEILKDGSVTEPKLADSAGSTRVIADEAVTNEKLRNSNALTIIGRSTNTNGAPADIALDANGKFLVRRANQIIADTIVDTDIPASIARDTEVTTAANAAQAAAEATAAAALAAHAAASDPHPVYLTQTEGDGRYVQSSGFDTADVPEGSNLYFTNARAQAAARLRIVRAITATDTVGATDDVIIADATSGAITVNLPALASNQGKVVTVKKVDASGNAVTLDGNSSEQIDGSSTQAISTQYAALTVVAGASSWHII